MKHDAGVNNTFDNIAIGGYPVLTFLLATFFGIWGTPVVHHAQPTLAHVSERVQPYMKWGRYALAQAQKRYPHDAIVDYLHVGRTTYSPTYVKETFKFWVKDGKREFGVFVKVYFDPHTDHVSQVLFCETDH
jgi:hypothetical protein